MVKDKQAVIIEESIRRLMEESLETLDGEEIELGMECPIQRIVGPEQMKRLAALNIAMSRIIKSVGSN